MVVQVLASEPGLSPPNAVPIASPATAAAAASASTMLRVLRMCPPSWVWLAVEPTSPGGDRFAPLGVSQVTVCYLERFRRPMRSRSAYGLTSETQADSVEIDRGRSSCKE